MLRDALDTVHEMSKLIEYSPRGDSKLEEVKMEISPDIPGFRVLCPTRWTVRAASMDNGLTNYTELQSLLESCYDFGGDSETRARFLGVQTQMRCFDLMFGESLGYAILRQTENLST
ncbi:hypothetical protein MAR_025486 [Mya arenaria]|uniref:Uncharacterized protein n=1 Tax=Mya arenaria TaxID=6604 RepID=A0ABY7EVU2_MYAAR|nr:hypothetical protein MAR_025486 [Mya arenaria]